MLHPLDFTKSDGWIDPDQPSKSSPVSYSIFRLPCPVLPETYRNSTELTQVLTEERILFLVGGVAKENAPILRFTKYLHFGGAL